MDHAAQLRAGGWVERVVDGAWSAEIATAYQALVGAGEYRFLDVEFGDRWIRGRVLISPIGQRRLGIQQEQARAAA